MYRLLALSCFFLSGVAGLVYEIAWIRRAALVFGATAPALSTVLAVFFGGLALGSWLGGRLAQRTERPLRWYGWLELALAASGVAATLGFGAVDALYGTVWRSLNDQTALLVLVRPLLVALLLLVPTVLMGATFPLFCRQFVTDRARIGGSVGFLYGLNTLGAALGCAAAGFVLLPRLGVIGTAATAAGLNLLAGATVLALRSGRSIGPVDAAKAVVTEPKRSHAAPAGPGLVGALFALTGGVALAGEVLWARFLALLVRNSVHTYTLALTVTLAGIVLGSLLAAWLADRRRDLGLLFGLLLVGTAIAVLGLMHLPVTFWRGLGEGLAPFFGLLLPPAILSGACLPVAVRLVLRDPDLAARRVGGLVALNTLGGIVGSLLAGFVLLPWLGLAGSLAVVTGLGTAGALLALARVGTSDLAHRGRATRWAAATVAVVAWALVPLMVDTRLPADFLAPREVLAAYAEGEAATLAAIRQQDDLVLQIDRLWQGHRNRNHQIVAAHVPMLLHPNPRTVAVIGVGVGQTASRFLLHPVERVDCVDIEKEIFPFIAEHFGAEWLDDRRVTVHADDGRTFVAHGRQRFDLISIEVGQTFRPGVEAFYTREFYIAAQRRLEDGGLVAQFVPLGFLDEESLRRIVGTFVAVFPEAVLWYNTSELLLIGGADLRVDPGRLARVEINPRLRRDLAYSQWGGQSHHLNRLGNLLGGFLCGPDALRRLAGQAKDLRDDRPVLAYATSQAREEDMRAVPLAELLAGFVEPVTTRLVDDVEPAVAARAAEIQRLNLADISSSAWRREGERRRAAGDLPGAVSALKKALEFNPKSADVVRVLADVYSTARRPQLAAQLFRRALEMRPDDVLVQRGLGTALVQTGESAEAVRLLRTVVEQRPADTQAWNTLGAALAGEGDIEGAIECFRRVLSLDPDDAAARRNLDLARSRRR